MILILSFSNLSRDQRVKRQVQFLKKHGSITIVGYNPPSYTENTYIAISKKPKNLVQKAFSALRLLTRRFETQYWKSPEILEALKKCSHLSPSLVIANDIESLPLALSLAKGAKVIFDAHEYAPKEFEDLFWKIFYKGYKSYLCRKFIPYSTKMITVCNGLAQEYEKEFEVKPEVITNAPNYFEITPNKCLNDKIRMVSHGYAMPDRKIEKMIEVMDSLDDRFELDLYLLSHSDKYLDFLKKRAGQTGKVKIKCPVPMEKVVPTLNQYDIGLYLLQPTSFNNFHSLPNKLFDFIQARLALAIGPSPEMKAIVERYRCGVVSHDFDPKTLAKKISSLDEHEIMQMKEKSSLAAKDLCSERNKELFISIVEDLQSA